MDYQLVCKGYDHRQLRCSGPKKTLIKISLGDTLTYKDVIARLSTKVSGFKIKS